jgi:hypothetical protein
MRRYLFIALVVSAVSSGAFADVITGTGYNGTGSASQQALPLTIDESGTGGYWENPSRDGLDLNVGFWLTGTGGYSNINSALQNQVCPTINPCVAPSPGLSAAQTTFLGSSYNAGVGEISTQPQSMEFTPTGSIITVTIETFISFYSPNTELGWYDVTTQTMHPLFDGASVPGGMGAPLAIGSIANFQTNDPYFFYVINLSTGTFFMDSTLNTNGEAGHQHFSVFSNSTLGNGTYYIGTEDGFTDTAMGSQAVPFSSMDEHLGDGNDLIFMATSTPEPATMSLCALGLAALISAVRRRK